MNFYIAKDDLNMRDKPAGTLLGTMRSGTIVYALGEPFDESEITWINVFSYDMASGHWMSAYSAIKKGEDTFLEPFIPSAKLLNPYRGDTYLTQLFGENPAMYARFGIHSHNGNDYAGTDKTIISVAPGNVTVGSDPKGYGNYVIVQGATLKILYAHLSQVHVQNGSYIQQGTVLGVEGSSGNSSASHLHVELRRLTVDDSKNGFGGRIDILPFLDWSNIIFPGYCSILNNFKGK